MKTMKRLTAVILVLMILLSMPLFAYAKTYGSSEEAKNGVARVAVYGEVYLYRNRELLGSVSDQLLWTGSAFAVGEKGKPVSYFVTNRHVASTEEEYYDDGEGYIYRIVPQSYYLIYDNEATRHPTDIVSGNLGGADLAVLKLREPTSSREPLVLHPYKDLTSLKSSTKNVYSVGYPGSQNAFLKEDHQLASGVDMISVRKGSIDHEVDGVRTDGLGTLLLTDAPISSGNSGGPLVDDKGAVVGVCTYGTYSDANMNAAVSVNEVISMLKAHDVPYSTASGKNNILIYAILGVAIVAIAVVVIKLLSRKKPNSSGQTVGQNTAVTGQTVSSHAATSVAGPTKPQQPQQPPQRVIVFVEGPMKGQRFKVEPGKSVVIGRDGRLCNLVLPTDAGGVSKTHCKVKFDGTSAVITDLGSSYGTFVNGKKIDPNIPVTLHRGLPVDLGSEYIRFVLQ